MAEDATWHLGRYTKPGDYIPCHLCGVSRRPEDLEIISGDRKICVEREPCERWMVLRASKGGRWT